MQQIEEFQKQRLLREGNSTIEIQDIITNFEELIKIKIFLWDFANKTVCVDPLDRKVCCDESDEENEPN